MTKRKRGIWTVETEDGHEHQRRLAQLVLDEKDTTFGQVTHAVVVVVVVVEVVVVFRATLVPRLRPRRPL